MSTIHLDYLYAGYTKANEQGELSIADGTLEPVANTVVISEDPTVGENRLTAFQTVSKGLLKAIDPPRKSVPHQCKESMRFFLPPVSLLRLAKAIGKNDWPRLLAMVFQGRFASTDSKKPNPFKEIRLSRLPFYQDSLKAPDDESDGMYRNFYGRMKTRAWFEKNKNKRDPKQAFVMAKTRCLLLVFSDASLEIKQVTVTKPEKDASGRITEVILGKKFVSVDGGTERCAGIFGDPEKLKSGVYSVEVELIKVPQGRWSQPVRESKSYGLSDKLHFNIVNLAGEFGILQCDPISIEEAVLTQFPDRFTHLLTESNSGNIYDPQAAKAVGPAAEFVALWSNRVKWSSEKVKLVSKIAEADGSRAQAAILGKAIFAAMVNPKDESLLAIRETIALAFSAKELVGA
jgi:hypothetical protein